MCLTISSGPHVADRDIPVLKVISKQNISEIFGFSYNPKQSYGTAMSFNTLDYISVKTVERGFHSISFAEINYLIVTHDNYLHISHDEGISHYFNMTRAKPVLFVIPKGATYYKGRNGELASDKIVAQSLRRMSLKQMESYVRKETSKSV